MLENIFAFEGRLTRLQFLGWGALLFAGSMIVAFILMMGCGVITGLLASGSGSDVLAIFGILGWIPWLAMTGADLWGGCGLQTRRVRDFGWSPLYGVGGLTAFRYIDLLLEHGLGPVITPWTGGAAASQVHNLAPAGVWVTLVYTLVLLFWPGRGPGPELGRVSADRIPRLPSPDSRPAPSQRPPNLPRTEFGLRGRR